MSVLICVPLALATLTFQSTAQSDDADVKALYTKTEQLITMRDGVKLFTAIYTPKDQSQRYPIMLNRTPYSVAPYGPNSYRTALGPSSHFQNEKFIFVYQDVRGRFMSEGEFVDVRPHKPKKTGAKDIDESTDTYDTIEWLVKNVPEQQRTCRHVGHLVSRLLHFDGRNRRASGVKSSVAPGAHRRLVHRRRLPSQRRAVSAAHVQLLFFASACRARNQPPKVRAARFEHGTPDGYRFFLDLGPLANANTKYLKNEIAFWNEILEHPNYDDFWQARNIRPHLRNIKPAVMTVGGWFDAEDLFGALATYKTIEENNPGARNTLVMGPWFHGGWARSDGDKLGGRLVSCKRLRSSIARRSSLPFFNCLLKDKCGRATA